MMRCALLLPVAVCLLALGTASSQQLPDRDGDGRPDATDNCIYTPNADQADGDGDHVGDACDACPATTDGAIEWIGSSTPKTDTFGCSVSQYCPCDGPRGTLRTWKGRRRFLACERRASKRFRQRRLISAGEQKILSALAHASRCGLDRGRPGDMDGDGIPDDGDRSGVVGDHPCASKVVTNCDDNCPRRRNRKQLDADGDLRGDRCDPDRDGDGVPNDRDNCPNVKNEGQEDGDHDGVGDACDKCQDTEDGASVDARGCD